MRCRQTVSGLAIAVATLLATPAAHGHHSFAPHFDAKKPANIAGTITQDEARNPHSYLHIAAVDENGRTREYVCESHGVTQLSRNGITPAILKVGAKIRVTGRCHHYNKVAKGGPSRLEARQRSRTDDRQKARTACNIGTQPLSPRGIRRKGPAVRSFVDSEQLGVQPHSLGWKEIQPCPSAIFGRVAKLSKDLSPAAVKLQLLGNDKEPPDVNS